MPGIIVSRPIFNTLFKLAHEEGLSINAFLTKLLETSNSDSAEQVSSVRVLTHEAPEQMIDASGDHQNGLSIPRQLEAAGVSQAQPRAIPSSVGQSGDSYIGETEKNLSGRGAESPSISREDDDEDDGSIWNRVVSMEGHKFSTSRGKKFTYKVNGEYVIVKNSSARIPRSQFAKAEKMWPVKGPSMLVGVYAPSVVWAIMKELLPEPVAG